MPMQLMTDEQRARMLVNADRSAQDPNHDPFPVVKLFTRTPTAAGS